MSPQIEFPSPTALLGPSHLSVHSPPQPGPPTGPTAGNAKQNSIEIRAQRPKAKSKVKAKTELGAKPKQSKSRNGCVTCKSKRLKCDETKPTCQQCAKRQVSCEGYKRDWKWKEFNEEMVINRAPGPARNRKAPVNVKHKPGHQSSPRPAVRIVHSPPSSDGSGSAVTPKTYSDTPKAFRPPSPVHSPSDDVKPPLPLNQASSAEYGLVDLAFSLDTSSPNIVSSASNSTGLTPAISGFSFPAQSGTPVSQALDSPLRSSDIFVPPDGYRSPADEHQEQETENALGLNAVDIPMDDATGSFGNDDIEEVLRRSPDRSLTHSRFSPRGSGFGRIGGPTGFNIPDIFIGREPRLSPYSPEMLMCQFNKRTCGILSVRDGQNENPWRTLIYPLVRESRALFHAIASMTAFHSCKGRSDMKTVALEHRAQSIKLLTSGIQDMRSDIAIAITLVLAFAESWDGEVSVTTGAQHLRGAKSFLNHALATAQPLETPPLITKRIRFLCNTWVYMDVLARVTSVQTDDSSDFDNALWASYNQFGGLHEIDPLMGCASTMFPLIGRVANLIRRLSRAGRTSLNDIAEANDLKRLLEEWRPPYPFNEPEDEQCEIDAAMQTAEAYRWATLLYLHQAVPEIPSRTAGHLAKKALVKLALVPVRSRTIIVQIYPLLLAGCEAANAEDRNWVRDRWVMMARTMNIANIDRCLEVVLEVWARRDRHETERAERQRRQARARSSSAEMFSPIKDSFSPDNDPSAWNLGELCNGNNLPQRMDSFAEFAISEHERARHSMDWSNRMGLHRNFQPMVDVNSLSPGNVARRSRTDSMEVREELEVERTVRGRQHWIGVMKDWGWEVLLG